MPFTASDILEEFTEARDRYLARDYRLDHDLALYQARIRKLETMRLKWHEYYSDPVYKKRKQAYNLTYYRLNKEARSRQNKRQREALKADRERYSAYLKARRVRHNERYHSDPEYRARTLAGYKSERARELRKAASKARRAAKRAQGIKDTRAAEWRQRYPEKYEAQKARQRERRRLERQKKGSV